MLLLYPVMILSPVSSPVERSKQVYLERDTTLTTYFKPVAAIKFTTINDDITNIGFGVQFKFMPEWSIYLDEYLC